MSNSSSIDPCISRPRLQFYAMLTLIAFTVTTFMQPGTRGRAIDQYTARARCGS